MVKKMFEALVKKVQIKLHNFGFELARANDSYRLAHLLDKFIYELNSLQGEAENMRRDLEDLDV